MFTDIPMLLLLIGMEVLVTIITWVLARTIGRWIARRDAITATLVVAVLPPVVIVVAGYVLLQIDLRAHPGSDWPAMAFLGALFWAVMTAPASFITSIVTIRRMVTRMAQPKVVG